MFATKPQWWDVMANVATGSIFSSVLSSAPDVLTVYVCLAFVGEVTTAEQALAASTSSASSPALPPGLSTVALYSSGDLPEWKPLDEIVFEKASVVCGRAFPWCLSSVLFLCVWNHVLFVVHLRSQQGLRLVKCGSAMLWHRTLPHCCSFAGSMWIGKRQWSQQKLQQLTASLPPPSLPRLVS